MKEPFNNNKNFIMHNVIMTQALKKQDLQRTLIGPISVVKSGSFMYLFCDEHLNMVPLSFRVKLYVLVRFAIYTQVLVWISFIFICSQVLDVSFFVHKASNPSGLPTFAEHDKVNCSCSTSVSFGCIKIVGFSASA